MKNAFSNSALSYDLIDVLNVPDYGIVLGPHIDPELKHYKYGVHFQAQFCFEYVGGSYHRNGVKLTYRQYTQDEVFEIEPIEKGMIDPLSIGYRVRRKSIQICPPCNPADQEVINILVTLPEANVTFTAVPIYPGSIELFENVVNKFKNDYGCNHICNEHWNQIAMQYPKSYSSDEYNKVIPLRIPLYNQLFGSSFVSVAGSTLPVVNDHSESLSKEFFYGQPIQQVSNSSSIIHSGNCKRKFIPAPTVVIDSENSNLPPEIQALKDRYNAMDEKDIARKELFDHLVEINVKRNKKNRVATSGKNKAELIREIRNYYNAL